MLSHFCSVFFATFMLVSHVAYANVNYTVSPVKQPSTMSCWAASTAMMLSHQRNRSVSIQTLLNEVGQPYKNIFNNNIGALLMTKNRRVSFGCKLTTDG